jgi:hypothetical protein
MPVKNISKQTKKEDKEIYLIKPTKEEKSAIKELKRRKKEALKQTELPINFNDDIILDVSVNEEIDLMIYGQKDKMSHSWEEWILLGEMKPKKKGENSFVDFICALWNSSTDTAYYYDLPEMIDKFNLDVKQEIINRLKLLENLSNDFRSFYKDLGKNHKIPDILKITDDLNWSEIEEMCESISKGHTVELS